MASSQTRRLYYLAWTYGQYRQEKTKKRVLERQRVWKRWYERKGWKVRSMAVANAYIAKHPETGEMHSSVMHVYDAETKERIW